MGAMFGAIFARQNDRSVATAAFFASGMIFSAANSTVFLPAGDVRPDLIAVSIVCLVACVAVLIAGNRFPTRAAGTLMTIALIIVVPSVLISPNAVRALNTAVLFGPFFLYLVWFMPMWFARVLGYSWIVLVDVLILLKFGPSVASVLMTITVTGLVLGELIGEFKRRLERTSITDPLCDVWNPRGFRRLLDRAVASSLRSGKPLTMLYLDLDDFKQVNDRKGHIEGDRVLQQFSRSMQERSRPQDIFARFGGDEFVLLLVDADASLARSIAERMHEEVALPRWSYGIAEWEPGESSDDFISRADFEMLGSKRERKGNSRQPASRAAEPR
ncbi:GGDEF domain-containing protein [Leucobacter sp. NPDC058333]|uniref:GGDEF domain-containing protein n=1 Tax=Leucobacter sp. NPDC058333 TaxID=3346450 RepID=UPI003650E1EC